jgi:4-carboxymuconolactone decarboxylase
MRLEKLEPGTMTERQRELSDRITARRGKTRGPFLVWLQSPDLCDKVEALGAFTRFESSLPLHLSELTLLLAARNWDAQYSWNAHVEKAIESGISAEVVGQIANKEVATFENADDQAFYDFCQEILIEHFVSDETFARAHAAFTSQQLVDTIGALGNFTMLGMCLNTFQVDLQPDRVAPFPDVSGYARVQPLLSEQAS